MKKFYKTAMILIFFLSFFYIASAFTGVEKNHAPSNETIITFIKNSEADILEANVTTTLEVLDTFWNEEEVMKIKKDLKEELGLQEKTEEVLYEENLLFMNDQFAESDSLFIHQLLDDDTNQVIGSAKNQDGDFITFKIYSTKVFEEKSSYIIIDIIQNKRYKDIVEKSNQSQVILRKYGETVETTMNFVGTYDKKLSKIEGKSKIDAMIHSVKGRKVEEVVEESYISTTIYTPLIPQTIQYGDKVVNLHLAMRYNDHEGKTYLYVANPLITLTY
ncbi:hypothetical protein CACET_c02250 [Clostridium aceticum]|uniref:Uncharacterized protein n=1 Tax=Clostridium aceticum TaxID=84022 RepID=A0A0D8I972_9CLOT|nr:YwmB family TATA-box binding protein [Clostridium aceticum]AKL93741.1 hypothetical protein CACET_c02250 [Clostridium aceticum]KJF25786.1 hypothetical protein TZ02_16395 [Clostridium aceticum]